VRSGITDRRDAAEEMRRLIQTKRHSLFFDDEE